MTRRERLDELTDRWRARHEASRPAVSDRQLAGADREALAARSFPYRSMTPARYVAMYGESMTAFTYDDTRYADAELDAWLLEVGRLLRAQR